MGAPSGAPTPLKPARLPVLPAPTPAPFLAPDIDAEEAAARPRMDDAERWLRLRRRSSNTCGAIPDMMSRELGLKRAMTSEMGRCNCRAACGTETREGAGRAARAGGPEFELELDEDPQLESF
mgnify:CR=1 FL=1